MEWMAVVFTAVENRLMMQFLVVAATEIVTLWKVRRNRLISGSVALTATVAEKDRLATVSNSLKLSNVEAPVESPLAIPNIP